MEQVQLLPSNMDIVIVDDHSIIRSGVANALSNTRFNVIAEATSVSEGLAVINKFHPDICIVDINLGSSSGIELIKMAIKQGSGCKFVVLTMHDDLSVLNDAKDAGAAAFVTKGAPIKELIEIIECISDGSTVFMKAGQFQPLRTGFDFQLTPREIEVLSLLPSGATVSTISSLLFLTQATVKTHLSSIYRKLAAANRAQAVSIAIENNLITKK